MKNFKEFLNESIKLKWPKKELDELVSGIKSYHFAKKRKDSDKWAAIERAENNVRGVLLPAFGEALSKANGGNRQLVGIAKELSNWTVKPQSGASIKKGIMGLADRYLTTESKINQLVWENGDFKVWWHGEGNFSISEKPDDEWYIDMFTLKGINNMKQASSGAKKYMRQWLK